MKSKDLMLIRKYLEEYKKDQLDYERILKYADIERLRQLIMDEALNADFHCEDGQVIFE